MKTTIEMAREAGFKEHNGMVYITTINDNCAEELKAFAELVRADEREIEREACAELVYNSPPSDEYESQLKAVYDAIRARGNT
jgi:hypothetical protein